MQVDVLVDGTWRTIQTFDKTRGWVNGTAFSIPVEINSIKEAEDHAAIAIYLSRTLFHEQVRGWRMRDGERTLAMRAVRA